MPIKKIKKQVIKSKAITVSGKRKTAVAKATIIEGSGKIRINKKIPESFNQFQSISLKEPIIIAKDILGDRIFLIDLDVIVKGGGVESQTEAARLAIARALIAFFKEPSLKTAFLKYDRMLLIADTRRKEQRKPNDSKARAKRQKSYR